MRWSLVRLATLAHVTIPPPPSTSAYFEIRVPCVSRGEPRNLHGGHEQALLQAVPHGLPHQAAP